MDLLVVRVVVRVVVCVVVPVVVVVRVVVWLVDVGVVVGVEVIVVISHSLNVPSLYESIAMLITRTAFRQRFFVPNDTVFSYCSVIGKLFASLVYSSSICCSSLCAFCELSSTSVSPVVALHESFGAVPVPSLP